MQFEIVQLKKGKSQKVTTKLELPLTIKLRIWRLPLIILMEKKNTLSKSKEWVNCSSMFQGIYGTLPFTLLLSTWKLQFIYNWYATLFMLLFHTLWQVWYVTLCMKGRMKKIVEAKLNMRYLLMCFLDFSRIIHWIALVICHSLFFFLHCHCKIWFYCYKAPSCN